LHEGHSDVESELRTALIGIRERHKNELTDPNLATLNGVIGYLEQKKNLAEQTQSLKQLLKDHKDWAAEANTQVLFLQWLDRGSRVRDRAH
jgi:hypothetical protein